MSGVIERVILVAEGVGKQFGGFVGAEQTSP